MAESEAVLLKRFAENGDSAAFSRIVQMHAGLVYGACLRVLDDRERAADAVQETFFQLVKHAGEVTGSVPAWLHRVATRKAIDVVRRDSARRRREAKYAVKRMAQTEKWEDISLFVDEAMDELDEETKDVLVRHFFEGKGMSQVGEEVGVSQATVSRRVEAGVAMLRDKLHKRGIIVAAAVLGGLLGQNAAQAAPAAVMAELGKMAMVGGAVAGAGAGSAPGAGAAGAAAGAGGGTATSAVGAGVMAGVKAKVITAAAVAVVGVGSVVTYNAVKNETARPSRPAATSPIRQAAPASRATSSRPAPRPAAVSRPVDRPEVPEARTEPADAQPATTANDEQPVGSRVQLQGAAAGAAASPQAGGYGGAGYGGYGGGYGGAVMGGMATRAADSNSTTSRRVSRRAYRDSEGNVHVVEVETEEQQAQDAND